MLPFNQDFVTEQNLLISDFQVKNMELCIKYCNIRINLVNETILNYKSHYGNEQDLEIKLTKIKEDTLKKLQKQFDEDHRIISNYTPSCRKVSSKINQNDSSFQQNHPHNSSQRSKRDRSLHNNSNSRYYNHSKKSRGNGRNANNSRLNGHTNSTPNTNRNRQNLSHTRSRSQSQVRE